MKSKRLAKGHPAMEEARFFREMNTPLVRRVEALEEYARVLQECRRYAFQCACDGCPHAEPDEESDCLNCSYDFIALKLKAGM